MVSWVPTLSCCCLSSMNPLFFIFPQSDSHQLCPRHERRGRFGPPLLLPWFLMASCKQGLSPPLRLVCGCAEMNRRFWEGRAGGRNQALTLRGETGTSTLCLTIRHPQVSGFWYASGQRFGEEPLSPPDSS